MCIYICRQPQGIFFTLVPQKKLSGYQEEHGTVKAWSLHLLGIQLTACGLLPERREEGSTVMNVAELVMATMAAEETNYEKRTNEINHLTIFLGTSKMWLKNKSLSKQTH